MNPKSFLIEDAATRQDYVRPLAASAGKFYNTGAPVPMDEHLTSVMHERLRGYLEQKDAVCGLDGTYIVDLYNDVKYGSSGPMMPALTKNCGMIASINEDGQPVIFTPKELFLQWAKICSPRPARLSTSRATLKPYWTRRRYRRYAL